MSRDKYLPLSLAVGNIIVSKYVTDDYNAFVHGDIAKLQYGVQLYVERGNNVSKHFVVRIGVYIEKLLK